MVPSGVLRETAANARVKEQILAGISYKEISHRLKMQDVAVKYHAVRLFKLAGVTTRSEFQGKHYMQLRQNSQKQLQFPFMTEQDEETKKAWQSDL